MFDIKKAIADILESLIEPMDSKQIYDILELPPNPEMGDLALPCFKLSKIMRRSPVQIAQELADKLQGAEYIERAEAVSGYLNIFYDRNVFIKEVLSSAIKENSKYGSQDIGKGRTVVIDYSSPNIAKPFHIGHLRSTVIGNSLYKIFNFMGYKCVGINYLGDWGTQFGKLIVAYKKWGSREKVEKDQIKELMSL